MPVTVAPVIATNVPLELHSIGHVTAYSVVGIRSRVDGTLDKVHFKEGATVKAGDELFTIDPRPFEAALSQAKANLEKDSALLRNAEIEEHRNEELLKNNILSREVYDQSRAAADALRASVGADKAAVENAQLQLSYCYIRAPINGRTSTLLVNAGNMVKNQDTTLVTLTETQPIYVDFSVPEQQLPLVREYWASGPGLPVAASAPGDDQAPSAGALQVINNTVDTNTGTILLRARFPNHDERLWPGQFVNVVVTLTTLPNATVVPAQAVQASQQGQGVFVIQPDSTVAFRPVQVRTRVGELLVVSNGVRPGEQVVTTGQIRLGPGTKVVISSGPAPGGSNAAGSTAGQPQKAPGAQAAPAAGQGTRPGKPQLAEEAGAASSRR